MMNYNEFKESVSECIMYYLPEEYRDYKMEYINVNKAGRSYEGLVIAPKYNGTPVATPVINMDLAYAQYLDGANMEDVFTDMANLRLSSEANKPDEVNILDYAEASKHIVPRLINTAENAVYLADKPHRNIEDLSVTYVVRCLREQGMYDANITDDLLRTWGITTDELDAKATENLCNGDYKLVDIAAMAAHMPYELDVNDINPDDYPETLFVLSNPQITYGAAMALNYKLLDVLVEKFGDIYVLPSSVDEVIIVPKFMTNDAEYLKSMVTFVNGSSVDSERKLSDHIYDYCKDRRRLNIIA